MVDLSPLRLLGRTTSGRHGMVAAPLAIPLTAADLPLIAHCSVADRGDRARSDEGEPVSLRSAGGGVARTSTDAEVAATAEALERYAAGTVELSTVSDGGGMDDCIPLDHWTLHSDRQQQSAVFPHGDAYPAEPLLTHAYSFDDNRRWWVPAALIALRRDYGALATSSGLAAHFSPLTALLRAVQELVERDAYVTTWVHGLAPSRIPIPAIEREVAALGGRVAAYDITPQFSPHPVACVAGSMPLRGRPRNSLGVACRASWDEAVEKAFLEFAQGTMFVGHQLSQFPQLEDLTPETCNGFDEHAVYWTVHADDWWDLPLHQGPPAADSAGFESANSAEGLTTSPGRQLADLVGALAEHGVRTLYRMFPTPGLDQIGLRVVRALSPDLVPLHHDHRWPFLGGTAADRSRRFPGVEALTAYPSPYPHALG